MSQDLHRDEIASQVDAFLASGGKIASIPIGMSGDKDVQWNGRSARKAKPGQTDAAHAAFESNRRENRRLLSQTVRYCADKGMTISATADAMDLDRTTVRKIAAEHGIRFGHR